MSGNNIEYNGPLLKIEKNVVKGKNVNSFINE